jgi:hypothetical protein
VSWICPFVGKSAFLTKAICVIDIVRLFLNYA